MSVNNLGTFLNIKDSHLRVVSGNVYAQGINIGGITVDVAHGLQSITNQGNVTTNTLQFDNATTGFTTTANATVGRDLTVTGNATVSSNFTVTGNVVISDDLTVTENLLVSNNLTVTGNTFYTNPAAVLVDSNVVTEYTGPHDRPLRKYPEVALTANSDKGYVASASSSLTSTPAYLAFDGTTSTIWHTQYPYYTENGGVYDPGNAPGALGTYSGTLPSHELVSGYAGEYITLSLPNKIKMSKISINTRVDSALNLDQTQSAEVIVVVGSHDGSTWEFVDTHTAGKYPDDNTVPYTFNVNTSTYYEHVGLICTNTGPTDSVYNTAWAISKLAFYGYEEGSGSLDTTLKSVYNVPATTGTQLEVYYDAKDLADGAVTSVTDLSPNSNGGSVTGDPQVSNGAFVFDGVGDSIGGSVTNGIGELNFTISMWVKPNVLDHALFLFGENNNNKGVGLSIGNSVNSYFFVVGETAHQYNTSDLVHLGEWSHLTLYRNNGEMSIYKNGIYIYPVSTGSGALDLNVNTQFTVGGRPSGASAAEYFNGSIANFRLYSKALNADRVKELYDYQKDYFLGSKSQVTLYKGHLGVGVTEPSGQLELAGDERIQAYPPRGMTGFDTYIEGHGVFTASASSVFSSAEVRQAYQAFNGGTDIVNDDAWISKNDRYTSGLPNANAALINGVAGEWLGIQFPYPIKVKQIAIQNRSGGYNDRSPDSGILWGSNDGTEYEQVVSWSGLSFVANGSTPSYVTINATNTYRFFRLQGTKVVNTNTSDFLAIGELKFFGTPGPTTLDKGSLSLTRSLDVPRVSRYDVDTETPRYEKLLIDLDTTVNSSPTDISGQGNHGTFYGEARYSPADKAFSLSDGTTAGQVATGPITVPAGEGVFIHSVSLWAWVSVWGAPFFYIDDTYPPGGSPNTTPHCVTDSNGRLRYDFWSNAVYVESTNIFPKYQWVHVGLVYKGGAVTSTSVEIYFDGVKQALTTSTNVAYTSPSSVRVSLGSTNTANIKISNFKIYSVALEPSEIKKLYNLGRTGRSMVISDTAVGIGKVPEAQLDVRGVANFGSRVGIGTTNPSDALHIYGSPMIQHDTVYDFANNQGWYKIGVWDPTSNTGARLKIKFLGMEGYSSQGIARGGETILYASCNNNNPVTKANIDGRIHAYGNPAITEVKFVHLDGSRHKFEIRAYIKSFVQMSMTVECTQTESFTKDVTASTDPGNDSSTVSHAIFTHVVDNVGNVGIGTTNPGTKLHVVHTSDYSDMLTLTGKTTSNDDEISGGILFDHATSHASGYRGITWHNSDQNFLMGGVTMAVGGSYDLCRIAFHAAKDEAGGDTVRAYIDGNGTGGDLNFTGQHRCFIKEIPFTNIQNFEGLIVSANQNKYIKMDHGVETGSNAITMNESLPVVSLSTKVNDKKCFGVISASEDPETRENRYGNLVSVLEKELGDSRVYINSVGEGAIWVTNINGSLESGDYITTSNVAGYGQKQDIEFLANYTVAKITMDCDFDPVTQPVQIIRKETSDVNYWVKTTYENVSEEEYSNLTEENRTTTTETIYTNEDDETFTEQNEQSTYTELEQTTYQKITKEESKTEREGYELEVRQELVNVLDEHGQIQWEDDPSGATEKAYKIRYLDANGNITDEANHVYKAAFVGCTYHCG